jgi:ring-1,2-phenylacetyl-CoA epoxidase subunit PaaE
MALHFHTLTVSDIRRETADSVSIALHIPPELREAFRFQAGQNLTVRHTLNGEEVRRSYSLCTAPFDGEWRIAIRKVAGGRFSVYANTKLKAGDQLDVMPPTGSFTVTPDPRSARNYVAFAAGSGITPVLSMLRNLLKEEPKCRYTLVYGNRTRATIMFREAIEALKDRYMDRFRVIHILSREETDTEIHAGRIDSAKCAALCPALIDIRNTDAFFLCGPAGMADAVRNYLSAQQVPADRIHSELFSDPGQEVHAAPTAATRSAVAKTLARITVKLDGLSTSFDMEEGQDTILGAALAQGLELPYSCRGGMCCTCKSKLEKGEVSMDRNFALEPDEVKAGYILTCQSHPKTPGVTINFDAR